MGINVGTNALKFELIPVTVYDAGRRINFAPVKSLDSSDSDSKLSDLKVLASNVKVNPVIS